MTLRRDENHRTVAMHGLVFIMLALTPQNAMGHRSNCKTDLASQTCAENNRAAENCVDLGPKSDLTILSIAKKFAPALWFSQDEPLRYPIPGRLPGYDPTCVHENGMGEERVVYFRVLVAKYENNQEVRTKIEQWFQKESNWSKPIPEEKLCGLHEIYLHYYFYYSHDIGVGPHRHDLEGMTIQVALKSNGDRMLGRALKVIGTAHGVSWYINELDLRQVYIGKSISRDGEAIASDALVPPIVLVEEGKHATVPDRNGDGVYTPSYDVNVYPHDAWGLRDTFRGRDFLSSVYRAELSKPRREQDIVWPRRNKTERVRKPLSWGASGPSPSSAPLSYDLRPVTDKICFEIRRCDDKGLKDLVSGTPRMCDGNEVASTDVRFGESQRSLTEKFEWYEKVGMRHLSLRTWIRSSHFPRTNPLEWVSYRYDGGHGLAAMMPLTGVTTGIGWFVPRFSFVCRNLGRERPHRFGAEVLYTKSASRSFGWYGAAGWESKQLKMHGRTSVMEAGLRVRFRIPKLERFLGVRVGLRANGFRELRDSRVVFEFGGGAW